MADGTIRTMRARLLGWSGLLQGTLWICLLLLPALPGCKRTSDSDRDRPVAPVVDIDPAKPEETLFQQLRSGSLQLAGVMDTLAVAIDKVKSWKPIGKDASDAIATALDGINAAGASLADFDEEPEAADVATRFAHYDERRIKAIEAGNDARHDLIEALGVLQSLEEGPASRDEAIDLIDVAIEDLGEAISALGGKVET